MLPCLSSIHCLSSLSCLVADAFAFNIFCLNFLHSENYDLRTSDCRGLPTNHLILKIEKRCSSDFRRISRCRKQKYLLSSKKEKISNELKRQASGRNTFIYLSLVHTRSFGSSKSCRKTQKTKGSSSEHVLIDSKDLV